MHVQRNVPYGDPGNHPVSVSQLNAIRHETSNILYLYSRFSIGRDRRDRSCLELLKKARTSRIMTIYNICLRSRYDPHIELVQTIYITLY